MWALDPIDGTKGFLRGEQFAVCLALIVDGQVQVGVMGCPNLPVDAKDKDGEKGCLFITVKGQGAFQVRHIFVSSSLTRSPSCQSPFFPAANVVISLFYPRMKSNERKRLDSCSDITFSISFFFSSSIVFALLA